jgi:hypothetical protein
MDPFKSEGSEARRLGLGVILKCLPASPEQVCRFTSCPVSEGTSEVIAMLTEKAEGPPGPFDRSV